MNKFFASLALLLISFGAQAALICDNCEYLYDRGPYLGGFLKGDRATFGNRAIVADLTARLGPGLGQSRQFDDLWVFDLAPNAGGTLTVGTKAGTRLDPLWAVEIYADGGSVCNATRCTSIVLGTQIDSLKLVMSGFTKTFKTDFYPLPAGRYVLRIAAGTKATGESAYNGTLIIR